MKAFYPDIEYNKSKRKLYFTLLILATLLLGGGAITFFILKSTGTGAIFAILLVFMYVVMIPMLSNYPVKEVPLIEINGNKIMFNDKTEIKVSDIVRVDVYIDVAPIKGTDDEKRKHLEQVASIRPEEEVTGACDIVVKDAKGKEDTKYNIVSDCVGALQALVDAGAKKYRIIFSMKRFSVKATFRIAPTGEEEKRETLETLSETDKLMQLM